MSSVFEIGGVAGWAVLAGPLILLVAALAMALVWPNRLVPASGGNDEPVRSIPADAFNVPDQSLRIVEAAEPAASRQAAPPAPPSPDQASIPQIEDKDIDGSIGALYAIQSQEAPATRTPVDPICALIDEALVEIAVGDRAAAAEKLRRAIMLAAKAGDRKQHAAARLELGDMAQADGDLHTACEHWQLARSLFEEERSAADAAKCEKRMTKNGCPTDWVLNDF
ncbi:MAG: hypothetical protein KJ622_05550 [Alphaproteobacteria bacterium]|nr:hypothetical protein [Alphaproteobacteria bacterium]